MANAHTLQQKEFIVRRLAAFEPPRAIVSAFRAIFRDTACDENDILATDPETNIVSPELHALFLREREAVLLNPKAAPFADQAARLIALSNQVRFYIANNQFPEARSVMRHIAEEQGILGTTGGKSSKGAGSDKSETPDFKTIEVTRTVVDPPTSVAE